MPEPSTIDDARQQYADALHADRTRRAIHQRLAELRREAAEARSKLSQLQTRLRIETEEADHWHGKGFAQIAQWVIGRLDDRRDLEDRQVVEAAARVADAAAEVSALETAIAAASTELAARPVPSLTATADAEAALRAALEAHDPATSARVHELETAAAECASQIREVDEARSALTRCNAALVVARDSLASAHSWGTYDTWFGGGTLASMAKRNHVEKALGAIDIASGALRDLRHELADVRRRVEVPTGLNVPSSAWTFDVWFDNFLSDATMQHRIEATDASVGQLRTELNTVRRALDDHRAGLVADASRLRTDASVLLTGPM